MTNKSSLLRGRRRGLVDSALGLSDLGVIALDLVGHFALRFPSRLSSLQAVMVCRMKKKEKRGGARTTRE